MLVPFGEEPDQLQLRQAARELRDRPTQELPLPPPQRVCNAVQHDRVVALAERTVHDLLCLPEAAMITGHTLVVDGGFCISG